MGEVPHSSRLHDQAMREVAWVSIHSISKAKRGILLDSIANTTPSTRDRAAAVLSAIASLARYSSPSKLVRRNRILLCIESF
jgi:hypothetical protein